MNPEEVVALLGFFGIIGFVVAGPIGRAFADRLRGRSRDVSPELIEQMDALRDELQHVRQQVAELAERQDFAERVLAQARERGLLNTPKER